MKLAPRPIEPVCLPQSKAANLSLCPGECALCQAAIDSAGSHGVAPECNVPKDQAVQLLISFLFAVEEQKWFDEQG
jgi:hypothetical protein